MKKLTTEQAFAIKEQAIHIGGSLQWVDFNNYINANTEQEEPFHGEHHGLSVFCDKCRIIERQEMSE